MAIDAQGAEKARPYAEKADSTFPTVMDEDNLLSQIYGFKAIPNVLFIDGQGVLCYKKYGRFDIRNPEFKGAAEEWADTDSITGTELTTAVQTSGLEHSKATDLFHRGMDLYRQGRVYEALVLWREGVTLEPDNYVIRKQVWAVENPEKFYAGDVDYGWQREQIEKGL